MLAAEEVGGLSGQTTQDNVLRVNDVPLALDIAGLGAERTHGRSLRFVCEWVLTRPPGRSRQPWPHPGTQPEYLPLVIGPVDKRKGPSRENDQANTHNELADYRPAPIRVKTCPRWLAPRGVCTLAPVRRIFVPPAAASALRARPQAPDGLQISPSGA
ncbi:hypothetical protein GCM10010219_30520 [Streptomyces netropsis]|nr:hypothetical protein GCM10010219_30520 [Streptomyces netropsis]